MAILIQVIPPLNYYYEHRGWFEEGIDGFEEAVRVLRGRDDRAWLARLALGALLSALSNLYCFTGQHACAVERGEAAVALLEALPPTAPPTFSAELPVVRGRALVYLGLAYLNSHRYDEAVDTCRAGLDLLQGRAPPHEVGFALNALGNILYLRGEYGGAGNYYQEAADCFQRSGDVQGYAIVLSNLGNIAFYQEDYDGAETLYRESLELKARLGDHWRAAVSRHNLGEVAYIRGHYAQARSYFAQSAAEGRALSHRGVAMESLNRLADVARVEGEREAAQEYLHEALSISQSMDNLDARANIHLRLARLAREGEALEEARYQLQRALNLRLLPSAQLNLLVEAAQLLSVQGDGVRALTLVHFVARQPESGREARERAGALAARWGSRPPTSVAEGAAARSRTLTLEEVRLEVLRALAAGS
jgi:tetratricopeptide (TPR) repeat protein